MKKTLSVSLVIILIISLFFAIKEINYIHTVKEIKAAPRDKKCHIMEKNIDFIWSNLKPDMNKESVIAILGEPNNDPANNVWIWLNNYDQYVKQKCPTDWRSVLKHPDGGYYIMFYKNKLISKMYAIASCHPWELIDSSKLAKDFDVKEEEIIKEFEKGPERSTSIQGNP